MVITKEAMARMVMVVVAAATATAVMAAVGGGHVDAVFNI
jgi:hypothetical protein